MQSNVFSRKFGYTSNMFWMDRAKVPLQSKKNGSARDGRKGICVEQPEGSYTYTKRKKVTMSNQPENENQQTITTEEVRQYLLDELDASQQAVVELSEEELETISGGAAINPNHPIAKISLFLGRIEGGISRYLRR